MNTLNAYRTPSGDYLLSPVSTVLPAECLAALDWLGLVSLEAFDDATARNLLTQIEDRAFAVLTAAQFRSGGAGSKASDRSEGDSDA